MPGGRYSSSSSRTVRSRRRASGSAPSYTTTRPTTSTGTCKDCGSKLKNADGSGTGRVRKPGPRCATCHKSNRRKRSDSRKATWVEKTYCITQEEYDEILKEQGGVCYICRKKPPQKRRLSVDHDHHLPCSETEHPPEKGCKKCVRGLLHSKCNSWLGWNNDDPQAGIRMHDYLIDPPARRVLMRGTINA